MLRMNVHMKMIEGGQPLVSRAGAVNEAGAICLEWCVCVSVCVCVCKLPEAFHRWHCSEPYTA